MKVMGTQYDTIKDQIGIDEVLADSSESEADQYIVSQK